MLSGKENSIILHNTVSGEKPCFAHGFRRAENRAQNTVSRLKPFAKHCFSPETCVHKTLSTVVFVVFFVFFIGIKKIIVKKRVLNDFVLKPFYAHRFQAKNSVLRTVSGEKPCFAHGFLHV